MQDICVYMREMFDKWVELVGSAILPSRNRNLIVVFFTKIINKLGSILFLLKYNIRAVFSPVFFTKSDLVKLGYNPRITIVIPVYNPPLRFLKIAIRSVLKQNYSNWELCIIDDGSTRPEIRNFLSSIHDVRMKVILSEKNRGISFSTNVAVASASGEFIAFLDHDDELTSDALFKIIELLNQKPDLDVIYSDQDKINTWGIRSEPFYKPDWSPEYFRSVMYVGHLCVIRRSVFEKVGGLDASFDGIQDYELLLRISEITSRIGHVSRVLYHWRMILGSVAMGLDQKGKKIELLMAKAVNAHLMRIRMNAKAERHPAFSHRVMVKPAPRTHFPKISIVIPVTNASGLVDRCLKFLFERTTYPNFNVIVVNKDINDLYLENGLQHYPITVISCTDFFNYSYAGNLGVENADGEVIVLLSNALEVITEDWLEQMLLYLDDSSVVAVGPMLIYPDKTIHHAGMVLGIRRVVAGYTMRGYPDSVDGYFGSLSCPRNFSAMTGECLMIRRKDYIRSGGLQEFYNVDYQDVDLCLRLSQTGMRIVYTPYAKLINFEKNSSRKDYDSLDRALLLDTWGEVILSGDPYYSPNFSTASSDYRAV